MSHRTYQTAAATGAATLGLCCTTLAINSRWWEAGMLAFVAVFLVEASARESRAHRDALARERMARSNEQEEPLLVPCCSFWTSSAGAVHAPDCHTWSTR
ncbi:hypothetical protein J7I98_04310 [Streptomyces sp. ISL-98]|uniref:hypothetical protein n=1 Tax=Streptomyces sp. ISL-98 TaxID=2819192 RepID=UPI001BE50859|nr:hypothetical protein [Streptomyces sp. ISL-98]MBT2505131.1 hypothetical protein [Streptomyces sp. ISL-98]